MRLLVLDHIFHKITKSSDFFFNILEKFASISVVYIDPKNVVTKQLSNLHFYEYDRIIFWQVMPPKEVLPLLPSDKTILIPMYDACCTWTYKRWSIYKNFRFISFCYKIHKIFLDLGIQSIYVKYVPEVIPLSGNRYNDKTAFIWNRTANFNLSGVIHMFVRNGVKHFICHDIPENKRYYNNDINISYTNSWFDTHEDYLSAVSKCHYFISPRLYEGIGMGFLEAMGLGLCVIAPNQATMNEYINDSENGYLFDTLSSLSFDSTQFSFISDNALNTYKEIKSNWITYSQNIQTFILSEGNIPVKHVHYIKYIFKDINILYNFRLKYYFRRKLNLLNY